LRFSTSFSNFKKVSVNLNNLFKSFVSLDLGFLLIFLSDTSNFNWSISGNVESMKKTGGKFDFKIKAVINIDLVGKLNEKQANLKFMRSFELDTFLLSIPTKPYNLELRITDE